MTIPTTGRFAAQHGAKLLHDVNAQIARTTESQGMDEVHDLRVAIRRFRRILDLLRPCFMQIEAKKIERAVKKIISRAGDVRDLDIAVKLIGKIETEGENPSVLAKLRKDRAKAAAALHKILLREGQQTSLKPPATPTVFCAIPMDRLARRILPAMAAEHLRCVHKAARTNPSDRKIHEVRIEARNFRYTLECFAPIFVGSRGGDELTIILEQLEDVQDRLGAMHDCAIVREIVEIRKSPAKKQVIEALKKRQKEKEKKFRKLYAPSETENARAKQWKEILLRVGPPVRKARKSAGGARKTTSHA